MIIELAYCSILDPKSELPGISPPGSSHGGTAKRLVDQRHTVGAGAIVTEGVVFELVWEG